ncbi:MAG TPA: hypothetical protein VM889_04650 [Candidatus Thermoplasmatota archaeon]|nr:hypothetical protein [Candidatus Thermoplasmatota archaeon]
MNTATKALFVTAMLMTVSGAALASIRNVGVGEVEAENHIVMEGRGQRNNLSSVPTERTKILDSFAYSTYTELPSGGPWNVRGVHACDPAKNTVHVNGNCVYREPPGPGRTTGLPKVILAGASEWGAWYGYWADNGNGVIDNLDRTIGGSPNPANDYDSIVNGEIVVFIEPGDHPTVTSSDLPGARSPDFSMRPPGNMADGSPGNGYWDQGQGWPILFWDGTLLRTYEVVTVADPVATPGGLLRTKDCPENAVKCLIDIDDYAAIAPGPLTALYASSAGPMIDALPPPSLASSHHFEHPICDPAHGPANQCETTGPLARKIQPPYENPRYNLRSTNKDYDYNAGPGAWIDTQVAYTLWSPGVTSTVFVMNPLSTNGYSIGPCSDFAEENNAQHCVAPGYLELDVRVGAFHDLDQNGWIGQNQGADPYEFGNNPDGNDYDNGIKTGEFSGYCADAPAGEAVKKLRIEYTLTPTGPNGWGPAGVVTHWKFPTNAATGALASSVANGEIVRENTAMTRHYTGSEPVKIRAYCYGDQANSAYTAEQVVLFPQGTAGITFDITSKPHPVAWKDPVEGDKTAMVSDTVSVSSWLL